MKQITHIDGLSGEEEALAIKTINEEVKTELYHKGPVIKGITETDYFCPICDNQLIVSTQQNGPDDYYLVAICENCNERWDE